jgi:hypothetical protein
MGQGIERYFSAEQSEEKRALSERQGKYHVSELPPKRDGEQIPVPQIFCRKF